MIPFVFHCISNVPLDELWSLPKSTNPITGDVDPLPVSLYNTAYLAVMVEEA